MRGDAPYIFINRISDNYLINIKEWFYSKRINFVDGYPFKGSCFKKEILWKNFKYEKDGIRLRIINTEKELALINYDFWDEIYDFSLTGVRMPLYKTIKIHIDHIKEVNQIL